MSEVEKFKKAQSIINSCVTYEQLQSCFSFVNNEHFFPDMLDRFKILGELQGKAYEMRNQDLAIKSDIIRNTYKTK